MFLPEGAPCEACPAGYFTNRVGEPSCGVCPLGKFQNSISKAYCEETKLDSLLKPVRKDNGTVMVEWRCVTGIRCNGMVREYLGGVWHAPSNPFPEQANMYTCVNDGCPDNGASNMTCKKGYKHNSPLCAVCDEGYYEQLRSCVECKDPNLAALGGFVLGFVVLMVLVVYIFRYQTTFLTTEIVANVKIAVSFFTIVSTMTTQFG